MLKSLFGRKQNRSLNDAASVEATLRESHPLLLHPHECIDLAFASRTGRDQSYLTSHRILLVHSKGLTLASVGVPSSPDASSSKNTKRKTYLSIPYSSIQAFSIECSVNSKTKVAENLDLKVWSTGSGLTVIDFANVAVAPKAEGSDSSNTNATDLFGLQQYLNAKVQWKTSTTDTAVPATTESNGAMNLATSPASPGSSVATLVEWLGHDHATTTPDEAQDLLTQQYPLLLQKASDEADKTQSLSSPLPPETVSAAFGLGPYEYTIVTNLRYLVVHTNNAASSGGASAAVGRLLGAASSGSNSSKLTVTSIPWHVVAGLNVTATTTTRSGGGANTTTVMEASELVLYTTMADYATVRLDYKNSATVDGWAVQNCIVQALLQRLDDDDVDVKSRGEAEITVPSSSLSSVVSATTTTAASLEQDPLRESFTANPRPLDTSSMNAFYRDTVPLLLSTEQVEMAFKGRRDVVLLTTRRILIIDPQSSKAGKDGKIKVDYTSIPWQSVVSFGVKTAGRTLDHDSEAMIYTNMMFQPAARENEPPKPGMSFRELDFDKDMVNVVAVKKYLSQKCLRHGSSPVPPSIVRSSLSEKGMESLLSRLAADDAAAVTTASDPKEFDAIFRTTVPLLLDDESTILAFQSGKNAALFTNLRIVMIETEGWSGDKVLFRSIPYPSIRAFSAVSAGGWDQDAVLDVYTRNQWSLNKLKIDLSRGKADIGSIQKLLGAMVLGNQDDVGKYMHSQETANPKIPSIDLNSVVSFFTNASSEEDAAAVDAELHNDAPLLLEREHVVRAFRAGRDLFVYTNLRVLMVDVVGLAGKKIRYTSFPWKWCHGFEIETAGHLDCDAELYLYNDTPARRRIMHSILVKRFDIHEMQANVVATLLFPNDTTTSK